MITMRAIHGFEDKGDSELLHIRDKLEVSILIL